MAIMGFKNNRDMVFANIVQQAVAALIFLFVPKILGVLNYAQVTYATTLLTFISFADFGLSFVYGRTMPAVYARRDVKEIAIWDSSIIRVRFYAAFIFAIVISLNYLNKYDDPFNAALLFLVPPISVIVQFLIASNTSQELFSVTRDINILQAIARLAILPSAMVAGVRGWIVGQFISGIMVLSRKDLRTCCRQHLWSGPKINWRLIYDNLPEAIYLGLTTTLWMQLLYSGRLFASFMYPDAVIAKYGLANSAYQVVSSMMIAAFIPQTVKTYKLLAEDQAYAVNYVFKVILIALPIIVGLVIFGSLITPWFFAFFFPEYKMDIRLVIPLIVCLLGYPVIVTLGALLIGMRCNRLYLTVIVVWLLIDWLIASKLRPYYSYNSASIAQLVSLSMYAITLLGIVVYVFREVLKNKLQAFVPVGVIGIGMSISLYLLR